LSVFHDAPEAGVRFEATRRAGGLGQKRSVENSAFLLG